MSELQSQRPREEHDAMDLATPVSDSKEPLDAETELRRATTGALSRARLFALTLEGIVARGDALTVRLRCVQACSGGSE